MQIMQHVRSLATLVRETDADHAHRYRNMAAQVRIRAGALPNEGARDQLLQRAADFDFIAEIFESKSRNQIR
jgi:hypothetical protein